ncbi:MAG TPA: NAD(P)H-hydrate dehydratase [Candidatus Limnocylindrales bacterium]|nr:NAD(P)H-hydrate dehydratase [Candidatus Limnocylindrales bacterium]
MPVPVVNIARMREWEKATWATGQTEAEVIRRVGDKIAQLAVRMTHSGDTILILGGKGHNGDDARAALEQLHDRRVETFNVGVPENDLPKLEVALRSRPALAIDGLFGIGLSRPLDDGWKKFIAAVNESQIPVLAVDVPSGLNADTGQPQGAAIEAAVTLTVGAPKIGMLQQNAWPFVGRLEVAEDVGLIPCPRQGELNWTLPGDFAGFPPRRSAASHKGSFGHLAIIAGSFGFHGAAVLAARGAQRAQPGLITLFTQEITYRPVAEQLQAVMVNIWKPETKLPESTSAILIGPGLAAPEMTGAMKMPTQKLWRDSKLPVIADASALAWLEPNTALKNTIRVITPHPGEAARLLGTTSSEVQANRPRTLREISTRFGNCWVVLKGHQTLVGRSTGEIFVNSSGNPYLAQGGSGDVLAGFIAGWLAQPVLQADVGKTLRYAVWQHGAAADALQAVRTNWVVEDLVAELGKADAS